MKDAIKIVLILVGAYLIWQYLSRRATAQPKAEGEAKAPPPTQPTAAAALTTPSLVATAAAEAGYPVGALLNADEWNYFYTQVRGTPGADPLEVWPERDRTYKMTVSEWWTGVSAHGLTGLRTVRRCAVC